MTRTMVQLKQHIFPDALSKCNEIQVLFLKKCDFEDSL